MKKKILILAGTILAFFFIYLLLNNKKTPTELPIAVISTIPKNNAFFVNEKSEVVLTLNRTIINTEGEKIKIEVEPDVKTKIVYLTNKIRISPETEFGINIEYKISVKYNENLIYTLNFKTNPFSKEQTKEEGGKQSIGDAAFNESYDKFLKDFPWYRKIPIERKDYTIVYDFELLSFRIIMNRKIDDELDKTGIKNAAINDLLKIGVKLPIKNIVVQEVKNN